MRINEAAAHALLGETVRRRIWRADLHVATNYLGLHLEVPGTCAPYVLTLEDLTASDWEVPRLAAMDVSTAIMRG